MSRAHLDWKDEAAVRAWLDDLRVAVKDWKGVTDDMLLPLRERELGHAKHREMYGDASRSLDELLDFAAPQAADGSVVR